MNKQLGAILLVAGCSIGAGMLGIPVMTGGAGFLPASGTFLFSWAFMALAGLVLAELTLSFQSWDINLISLGEACLGSIGKWVIWFLFSFLFYAILIAYSIAGGVLLSEFCTLFFGWNIEPAVMSVLLTGLLFFVVGYGDMTVDGVNRILMIGLFLCYALMIFFSFPEIASENLYHMQWHAVFISLPILVISFGYHNLIPSLARYLDGDRKALKRAILIGSLIPLCIYLLWEYVILGIVPLSEQGAWQEAQDKGHMITQLLERVCHSTAIVNIARGFAFFSIATSFLPVALSFVDFLRDGFRLHHSKKNRYLLTLAVLLPPLIIALTFPKLFLTALNIAGGIAAVLLFAFLPALMVFRRKKQLKQAQLFPVSNTYVLLFLMIGALCIIGIELAHELKI